MFDQSYDYGLLPSLTGFILRRASLYDFSQFAEAVGDRSITPQRYAMLELVGANPGLQQVKLGELLGLSKPAATLALDFWQSRQCIERRREANDRRAYGILLTETGRETLTSLQAIIRSHDRSLTKLLSEDEVAKLHEYLQRIYEP
jgi:DNA-binding MarR family transcriptional regulator